MATVGRMLEGDTSGIRPTSDTCGCLLEVDVGGSNEERQQEKEKEKKEKEEGVGGLILTCRHPTLTQFPQCAAKFQTDLEGKKCGGKQI